MSPLGAQVAPDHPKRPGHHRYHTRTPAQMSPSAQSARLARLTCVTRSAAPQLARERSALEDEPLNGIRKAHPRGPRGRDLHDPSHPRGSNIVVRAPASQTLTVGAAVTYRVRCIGHNRTIIEPGNSREDS